MARVKRRIEREMPELSGLLPIRRPGGRGAEPGPAGADRRAGGGLEHAAGRTPRRCNWRAKIRKIPGVADVFIPQDIDYPALQLDVDRMRAGELGLDQREVVGNVITALTSNQMIAPSFWIDPKTGNDYMLTVQYPENQVRSLSDLRAIPLRGAGSLRSTRLDAISSITRIKSPTEVDHYQLRRTIDIYVRPLGEDLGRIADCDRRDCGAAPRCRRA